MSVSGHLATLRFGLPRGGRSFPVSTFDDTPVRLMIAPVNYSAQATAWAAALERADPDVSATNMSITVPHGYDFPTGLDVPLAVYHNSRSWQRRQFETVASHASHVLIEAMEAPFGRLFGRSVATQADALERRGVRVAYIQHGTEVRIPSLHAESDPWSYYRDATIDVQRAEQVAQRNVTALSRVPNPVFVSTPDLLRDLPFATWCPVVVDPAAWRTDRIEPAPTTPLRVTHAPTNPALKGTPLITPVLQELQDAGVIELQLAHGVPSGDMRALYEHTDVYLDQFRLGSYGVAACEAMAAGCVVIGHVSEQVRTHVQSSTGLELPIVQATPDTVGATLRGLAADRNRLASLRETGSAFVTDVHDGRRSSRVLLDGWIRDAL